jgi:hypothetical protein
VGVYLDVYDCVPEDPHAYGSEQLMRVDVNDKLGEQLSKRDLIKVKGELDKRGHFRGAILEEFRKGEKKFVCENVCLCSAPIFSTVNQSIMYMK